MSLIVKEVEIDLCSTSSLMFDQSDISYCNAKMKMLAVSNDGGVSWELVAYNHYAEEQLIASGARERHSSGVAAERIHGKPGVQTMGTEGLQMVLDENQKLKAALEQKHAENKKLRKWCEHLEHKLLGFVDLAFDEMKEQVGGTQFQTRASNGAGRRHEEA